MAVGAPHDALVPLDLSFDCGDGFERRDIRRFALHVVAVHAAAREFVVRDPRLDLSCAVVRDGVDAVSVTGLGEPVFTPGAPLLGSRLRAFRTTLFPALIRAVLRLTLRLELRVALNANPLLNSNIRPWRHAEMISTDDRNPCKPDIFEATYEAVELGITKGAEAADGAQ